MIDVFHDFLEDFSVHLYEVTFTKGKYACRTRGTVNDTKISKRIAEREGLFLFIVDLNLTGSFQYDIVRSAFVTLFEDVTALICLAGPKLIQKTADFFFRKLRKNKMSFKGLFDLDQIAGRDCLGRQKRNIILALGHGIAYE